MFGWRSPSSPEGWARPDAAPVPNSLDLASHRRRHLGDPLLGLLDGLERLLDGGQRVDGDVDDARVGQVGNNVAQLLRSTGLHDECAGSFAREREELFDTRFAFLVKRLEG